MCRAGNKVWSSVMTGRFFAQWPVIWNFSTLTRLVIFRSPLKMSAQLKIPYSSPVNGVNYEMCPMQNFASQAYKMIKIKKYLIHSYPFYLHLLLSRLKISPFTFSSFFKEKLPQRPFLIPFFHSLSHTTILQFFNSQFEEGSQPSPSYSTPSFSGLVPPF